jgi:thiol-disulfide isomerase/thioredoxin
VRSEEELRDVMRAAYGNERASTLLVVEFYGKWCNSCRRLYPRLMKLAKQEQDVLFVKIDFDACKDLCRKLGVVKLPYFHVYNGSGSRLADFSASLDPVKFQRLTDSIEKHRAPRCVLKSSGSPENPDENLPSLVKLHHVTFNWRGGGEDVMLAGDVAGGWTHTLALKRLSESDGAADERIEAGANDGAIRRGARDAPTHSVTAILPTGTFRFKFIVDGAWTCEPFYPTVKDAAENVNNEIFVGAASWPFEWVRVPGATPAGPAGRTENIPVARVADGMEVDSSASRGDARQKTNALAAPVSFGVAKIEASNAKFVFGSNPSVDPSASASARPPPTERRANASGESERRETWPKQIKVSQDEWSTRTEHEAKVKEETAQAFRALEFRRAEMNERRGSKPEGPYSTVSIPPSVAPVPVATPATATRDDLLTLEDRVRRLEQILENHGIGVDSSMWLREG